MSPVETQERLPSKRKYISLSPVIDWRRSGIIGLPSPAPPFDASWFVKAVFPCGASIGHFNKLLVAKNFLAVKSGKKHTQLEMETWFIYVHIGYPRFCIIDMSTWTICKQVLGTCSDSGSYPWSSEMLHHPSAMLQSWRAVEAHMM